MRILSLTCLFFVILLASCQKETNQGGGGTTTSNLLTRIVSQTGTDSTVEVFSYNNAGKLIDYRFDGKDDQGAPVNVQQRLIRNSANVVQQVIIKSNLFVQIGLDSIISVMHYNTGSTRYTSRVTEISLFGFTFIDSVAFDYDAAGKIIRERDYQGDNTSGFEEAGKTEYTYSGTNLTGAKFSSFDPTTGMYTEEQNSVFEYDAKVAPLIMSTEGIATGLTNYYSANNVVKQTITSPTDPTINDIQTVTYTYRTDNRPLTAASSTTSGQTSTTKFYYQ